MRPTDNRLLWIGMLELTRGWLDGSWITGAERKQFDIFFPCYATITIWIGVIFLITNRVNKANYTSNKSLNHKIYTKIFTIKEKANTPLWNSADQHK